MPQVSISPVFNGAQFFDNDGLPLSGGKLFQYEAGSMSVQQTTYADDTGNTPNSNPIVLDSSGRMPTDLWLEDGLAYNFVLTLPDGTTVLETVDNIIGVIPSTPGGGGNAAIWTTINVVPTYISPTQFLLAGSWTTEFATGNRVRVGYTGPAYRYGTVSAVATAGGNTQVTLVNDNLVQNAGMTEVSWSLLTSTGPTVDAAGVSYLAPTVYNTVGTVGYQIKAINATLTPLASNYAASQLVWTAAGTNAYTVSITPAITSYSVDQIFTIKFTLANSAASTLNINGLGAIALIAYDNLGAAITPRITANQVAQVAYNGTQFVMLTQNVLPSQTGQTDKVLTTDGTKTIWASLGTAPTVSGDNGYTILPGKFMIQWGLTPPITYPGVGGGTQAITFPEAFATCYGVQATRTGTGNEGGNKRDDHAVTSVGPTGFTMFNNYENLPPQTFYWLAYGVAP